MASRVKTVIGCCISLILLAALGACGGDEPSGAGTGYPPKGVDIQTRTPQAKGPVDRVVWNLPYGEPASLDPLKAYALPENTVLSNMCESLLRIDADLNVTPGLATVSQPSADTLVFTLRKGARFWNGKPVTAEDVVYSLRRQVDPRNASFYDVFTRFISSVKQTGQSEVTVRTNPPLQMLKGEMATGLGVVLDKEYTQAQRKDIGSPSGGLMCSGPFKFRSWDRGEQLTLTRNSRYWDTEHQAKVNNLIFKFVTDPAAITNGLLSGELDGSYEVPVQGIQSLRDSESGKLHLGKNLIFQSIISIQKTGPFSDPAVRRALSLAMDRSGIAQTVFKGLASPLSWPGGEDTFGYAKSTWTDAYKAQALNPKPDIEHAKSVLASAQKPTKPIVIAALQGDYTSTTIAQAAKSAGGQIGLKVDVAILQPSQFINLLFSESERKGIDAYVGSNSYIDQPDPMYWLVVNARTGAFFNTAQYSNATVDRLTQRAEAEADATDRAKIGVKAMKIFARSLTFMPIAENPQRMYMSNDITGAPSSFSTFAYYPWAADIGAAK